MSPTLENRRCASRKSVVLPCQIVRDADTQVFAEHTSDLSESGMLVHSDAGLSLGDTLTVSFQTTAMGIWVDARGTVVRMVKGRRKEDSGVGFGVRFDVIDPVKRLVVRGALRRSLPPLPKRPRNARVA
jgi:c-di-GMP-binding flagellar brake protein YcgR